jgi:hypothetical protein
MFNEHATCIAKLMVGVCEDIFLFTQQSTSRIDEIFVLNPILFKKPWCTCFLNIQHIHAISNPSFLVVFLSTNKVISDLLHVMQRNRKSPFKGVIYKAVVFGCPSIVT